MHLIAGPVFVRTRRADICTSFSLDFLFARVAVRGFIAISNFDNPCSVEFQGKPEGGKGATVVKLKRRASCPNTVMV
jgi:hypothetical protein